jgi:GT2 family glycosyltransferase
MRHPMKTRPALCKDASILLDGQLHAKFPAGAAIGGLTVAVVLDGVVHDTITVSRGGTPAVVWPMPRHRLFNHLDLLRGDNAAPCLVEPLDLAPTYALACTAPALRGLAVHGSFTAAPWLAASLGVELMEGAVIAGQGLAHRPPGETAWHYDIGLINLPAPGRALHLHLRVGGLAVEHAAVHIAAGGAGYTGCLDVVTPTRLEGWAMHHGATAPVQLEVVIDGIIAGRLTAAEMRPDLKANGLGDGRCGFAFDLPSPKDARARKRVGVRLAGHRTELTGSPVLIDPRPDLLGRFDTLHGMSAHGWAMDRAHPHRKVMVEAVGPSGEVLGTAPANSFRGDLLGAGLADGLCAFKIDLSGHFERLIGQDITVRFAGTNVTLAGSPHRILSNGNMQRFLRRRDVLLRKPGVLPRLKRALTHRAGDTAISIIMPVFNPPRTWLSEALESVRHQFCENWELICVDDGSSEPYVQELLRSYARNDPRVRVLSSPHNVGVTRATNYGLRAARHPYVMFLDHDDYLEPDAVWQLIRAARLTHADLLYGDEALTDEHLKGILEFRLRPAFSHDYYLSHPYFVHPICVRTEIARRIGGLDETLTISADVDFVLRVMEQSAQVTHVPAVLYRWRTHSQSSGHAKQAQVMHATLDALQRHLNRITPGARATEGPWFNQFRIDWPAATGEILVVIPTKNGHDLLKTAVDSIERTAAGAQYRLVVIDHESDDPATQAYLKQLALRHHVMPYKGAFNFSRMNNQAVARHGKSAEFVLFLNNDVEATQPGWLARLASLAARADVGAVGALLMYADKRVQHAGVVIGFNNSADHALRLQEVFLDATGRRNLGYNCSLTSVREFSAVTAACIMMRRSVFEQVGGFDTSFGIGFNDTDLCLRIGAAGYKILYDGYTILYHYESATRSQTKQVFHPADTKRMTRRWGEFLQQGDPFYNPNLSLRTQDHVPREDPDCRITYKPRARAGLLPPPKISRDISQDISQDISKDI